MNTKQLTVLWYGVLAAVAILLVQGEGEVWPSLWAVALLTTALIYTLGPMHSARPGRVAAAVAAPFVLAGLGIAVFYGYRSWRHNVAADAVTVRDIWVTKKADCPSLADSTDLAGFDNQTTDEPSLLRGVEDARRRSRPCHRIEGMVHNSSKVDVESLSLKVMLSDTAGQTLSESVEILWAPAGERWEFSESVHLPAQVEDQRVDSVRVREVKIDE